MISRFFIHRPIFATVISLLISLAGIMAMTTLPIAEFPEIVPPEVEVKAYYPGASAEVISQNVAAPLEQEINGVDNMLYMRSTSASDGTLKVTVTFAVGTDPDQNTINVNNRVQAATSSLPTEVTRQGVTVTKKSSSMLQVVGLRSDDERYDTIYMSNYASVNVVDEIKRLPGVGDAEVLGAKDYSMRVWLKPDKLAQLKMTPADIAAAINEQNAQFAAGAIGNLPQANPVETSYTVTTKGRLATPEEFGNIILRANEDGSYLRLRDVARLELGSKNYNMVTLRKGKPSVNIAIYLSPGANALQTADSVIAAMDRLAPSFPDGLTWSMDYDITDFVRISVEEVRQTLFEAFILVALIIFLFLQNWRPTVIPLLAVPVSIIGTFAGMYALGFSINTLTLFGLVLAIGIVVDDAIVVIENVERVMTTEGLGPKEATIKAMEEVAGAVIAIVLVLCSVFVPVAFMGGLAGEMYKQFAVTIAVSVVISGIVALTLTPALCAILLKPGHQEPIAPLRWFNRFFERITNGYTTGVRLLLKRGVLAVVLLLGLCGVTWHLFQIVPSALVPEEDKGYAIAVAILPPGASISRTEQLMRELETQIGQLPEVDTSINLIGFNLLSVTANSNFGTMFIKLKPWDERGPGQSSHDVVKKIFGMGAAMEEGIVLAFMPPPINGMSNTGGFEGYIQSRTGASAFELADTLAKLQQAAAKRPELAYVQSTFNVNSPQLHVELDREKARAMGVPVNDVFSVMQATFGSYYVNDFNKLGRTFQVNLQSEGDYRRSPEDLGRVYVRSSSGDMVPLTALVKVERTTGPEVMERYNVFPAAKIMGAPAPGYSSGQALAALEEVAAETLTDGYTLAWTGSAYQERLSGGSSYSVFVLGLLMVFLILAAQYEKWNLPLAVLMVVPFALFGAIAANWMRGLSNDVYFQIALITLIGLSAKNAILIVEFAVQKRAEGMSVHDAALEAARLRFRPIVMTSLAFVLGCVPLAISSGAGAASRHSIGTGVIGGMLAATFIATFFIPAFYKGITRFTDLFHPPKKRIP
ncbi:efflux RND transporter permease subunit [Desulfovibrio ferrophilus]|uniref:Hydrophobe/amphiphile efflux-1 family protein n=1 Tax=Desulfovibrio ferrophilus TaxID=241368 RepID=A0A2Z6AYM1_9BACT|nr:multidrug efflux RND transporter permease subunit [Desulfovibrio ferrophilus]BBD08283.1 hydrophobe/amphiphile efflux-1 family protein [Desulfovibrio ferrophilus]